MVELLELLRAKSERESEDVKLLLKEHICESLKRVEELKKFVEINGLKTENHENFFKSLSLAVLLHDLGKISYRYQKDFYKGSELPEKLRDFLGAIRSVRVRHEILSALWSCLLLTDNNEWTKKIRTAVLLHHYNEFYTGEKDLAEIVSSYMDDVVTYLEFIVKNQNEFEKLFIDLLEYLLNNKNIKDSQIKNAIKKVSPEIIEKRAVELKNLIDNREDLIDFAEFYEIDNDNPDYEFMFFLGCLRRCDYSASGNVPIENVKTSLKEIFENIDEKIKEKINKEPDWQKTILSSNNLKDVVLIAPTGAGKTEFALLWNSEIRKKLVYTLPLRVALNDLFHRFKGYFDENFVDILHSTSFIEYLEEEWRNRDTDIEKKLTSSKLLSNSILLTTPDQVFLTSLNYYGSDKVVAVYPFSSIVIDEIQTYNPEMASIIIKTLDIVKKLGGNVLVMTATLPPYFEPFFFEEKSKDYENLVKNYNLKFEKIDTAKIKDSVKNYTLKRHKIEVARNEKGECEWLTEYIKEGKKEGSYSIKVNEKVLMDYLKKYEDKNTFIVLNNVSKAIEVYKVLKEKMKNGELKYSNLYLLHARLIEKEKDRRIKEIKEKLGKNEQVIVVATQIIEASVNLDFDVMITEISPIDSQVQRWGRIYRNRIKDYNEDLPNIIVFIGRLENGGIKIDRGTGAIYDKRVVEKTIEVLKEFEGKVLSYEDEKFMIDEVFNRTVKVGNADVIKILGKEEVSLKDIYIAEIKQNLDFLKYFSVEKKSQAQSLFRRIAGVQVVIPEMTEVYGDEIDRKLAGIIKNSKKNDMTWKEMENEIGASKWEIKKRLYQYSVNIPIFRFEDLGSLINREFKGFYVLEIPKEHLDKLLELGIEKNVWNKIVGYEEDYSGWQQFV